MNLHTVLSYPESVGLEEIDRAGSKFLQSLWISGITLGGSDLAQLGIDAGGFVIDVKEVWCDNHTCSQFRVDEHSAGDLLDKLRGDSDGQPGKTNTSGSRSWLTPMQVTPTQLGSGDAASIARQLSDIAGKVNHIRDQLEKRE